MSCPSACRKRERNAYAVASGCDGPVEEDALLRTCPHLLEVEGEAEERLGLEGALPLGKSKTNREQGLFYV